MINFCKVCIMPSSRPRIVMNNEGVCNACINAAEKKKIDWLKRKNEFLKLIETIKKKDNNSNQFYDCVVPWSGGKDSTSIALKLKLEFDLNPLLVTFSPLIINEHGSYNRELLRKEGFDSIFIRPDQKVSSKLAKRFFIERGNPKVAWDAGVNAAPIQVALNYKIPTIFYAEHGESEYGGLVISEESKKRRDVREVIEHQIGDYPENWVSKEIDKKKLYPYIYPSQNDVRNLNVFYFSYFFKWSMLENWHYVKKILPNFRTSTNGRTQGTFTDFDSLDDKIDSLYYYMQYIKFGFGRATRDSCRMIQNDQLTRAEAIEFAKKYDHEFPSQEIDSILKYLNLNLEELNILIDRHRNREIWNTNKKNQWELINKIYND